MSTSLNSFLICQNPFRNCCLYVEGIRRISDIASNGFRDYIIEINSPLARVDGLSDPNVRKITDGYSQPIWEAA